MFDLTGKRVWVAGHQGMVGSALVRRLRREACDILTVDRPNLDMMEQAAVRQWVADNRPDALFLAAGKVGGIMANDQFPAEFLYNNLMIVSNIVDAAHRYGVERICFLGSSCIYPKFAEQPIREEALLTGPLEPTNEWYAVAKIAGIKLMQSYRRQYGCDYISAMPTNLYGPNDNFDLQSSHVLPALMRKAHEAKRDNRPHLTLWGTGTPRREFLHVDDCADACVHLMQHYSDAMHINVGSGDDIAIKDVAQIVCDIVGYRGAIVTDPSKPDGTPRKLMSADRINALGWRPRIGLREGIAATYQWCLEQNNIFERT